MLQSDRGEHVVHGTLTPRPSRRWSTRRPNKQQRANGADGQWRRRRGRRHHAVHGGRGAPSVRSRSRCRSRCRNRCRCRPNWQARSRAGPRGPTSRQGDDARRPERGTWRASGGADKSQRWGWQARRPGAGAARPPSQARCQGPPRPHGGCGGASVHAARPPGAGAERTGGGRPRRCPQLGQRAGERRVAVGRREPRQP